MIVDGNGCKPLYAVGDIFDRTPKQKDKIPKMKRKKKKAGFGSILRVRGERGLSAPVPDGRQRYTRLNCLMRKRD